MNVRDVFRLLLREDGQREMLMTLRREVNVGVEAGAAGRFSKKSVSDIVDEVINETRPNELSSPPSFPSATGEVG